MSGSINSLGLGSGVLTADLLDKLRGADEANIIKPLDNKITLNNQKGQALDLLNSLLTTFKSSVGALDDDTLYQKRSVSGSNDGISVTTVTGAQVQDFSVNVTNIAKKNVLQSATYTSSTSPIANGSGTLKLGIGNNNYAINYTSSTTLSDLKQAITDAAGTDVSASVLQTGTSAFSLVITSKSTGKAQSISLTDTTGQLKDDKLLTPGSQSGSFVADSTAIATTAGTLNINIGTTTVPLAYTTSTKLSDLVSSINADTTLNTKVTAHIVQFGTSDYRMVLTPTSGDKSSVISISDAGTGLKNAITSTTNAARTGTFAVKTDPIASTGSTGNISVNIGTTTASFAYTDTTSLQDLTDSINADPTLNTKVTASIVQFGTSNYRMVLTQKDASTSSPITLTDSTGGGLLSSITATSKPSGSMGIIQDAKDANFTYDGISMSRSSNSITDITNGTTINLLKDGGSANISISQDRAQITTEMEGMVNNYNTLIKQIGDMTAYDATAGKVGIFNGDNTIKNISREITKIITSSSASGYSLPQYGISLDKKGIMTFDKAIFTAKLDADPTAIESFFSGKTAVASTGTTKTGSFTTATGIISNGLSGGVMSIEIAGIGHSFTYTNTTTLTQLKDSINADSAITSKVTASIVQFGTADFRMVLTPKGNAVGEKITFTDSSGGNLLAKTTLTTSSLDIYKTTDGVFTSLNNLFKNYTSPTGLLSNLTNSSKAETKALDTERTKANNLLTARYATLQAKFAAYDSMISKLNSQFSSLKQQIDAQANANK